MNSDVLDTIEAALNEKRDGLKQQIVIWQNQIGTQRDLLPDIDEIDTALAEVRRLREAGPQPNWDDAPGWAMWWTVDADGATAWWQKKPCVLGFEWWTKDEDINNPDLWEHSNDTTIPLGIDWRTLICRRTQGEG